MAVVKTGHFYEGGFLMKDGQIVPDNKGKLFNAAGLYDGGFNSGVAHGQGTYTDCKYGNVCAGLWINGELRNGSITNKFYTFKGEFVDGVAHGEGSIEFNMDKASYKGHFVNGVY